MAVFNVAGYLIAERRRWLVIYCFPHEDNIPNKLRILKERQAVKAHSDKKTEPVAIGVTIVGEFTIA